MGWNDYGFPDVTMMNPLIPTNGIRAALKERFPTGYALDDLDPYEIMKSASNYPSRMMYLRNYINQFLDMNEHPDHIFWDYWDMKAEIEKRVPSGEPCILNDRPVIGGTPPHPVVSLSLLPDWPVMVARQQYLNANLLKIKDVPAFATVIEGQSHTLEEPEGVYLTAEEAWDAAISKASFYYNVPIGHWLTGFYTSVGPTYEGNSYYCGFVQPIHIEPDYSNYPELVGLPAKMYFLTSSNNAYIPNGVFDAHGLNMISSSTNFSAIDLPYHKDTPVKPDRGLIADGKQCGFAPLILNHQYNTTYGYYCGVDVSSLFEFYDNVDGIPDC